jgi:hypothetical protein
MVSTNTMMTAASCDRISEPSATPTAASRAAATTWPMP